MLKTAVFVFTTSYVAWYIENHELSAVYPFDATYETPEAAGEPRLTEQRFMTEDGESLVLWQAEAAPGKPTILYFPGNAGGLKARAARYQVLIDQGFGVVAPAYRGSSGSTGKPNEDILLEDARTLAQTFGAGSFVIYGESLGSAVAIRLASEGFGDRIVLEAPFTSIPDLLTVQYPAETLDHLITQRWDSARHVGNVTQPLLVIHGESDRLVPIAMGEHIFATAGSTDKQMLKLSNMGHSGLWTSEVQSTLFDFLSE